jgi:hypothetical protein
MVRDPLGGLGISLMGPGIGLLGGSEGIQTLQDPIVLRANVEKNGCAATTNTASIEVCSFQVVIQGTAVAVQERKRGTLETEIIWRMDMPEAQSTCR